jgi:hypothetical protein
VSAARVASISRRVASMPMRYGEAETFTTISAPE